MDFNKIIARAKAILLTPKTEWPVIAGESGTTQSLLVGYALPLAAAAAIAGFLKNVMVGTSLGFLGTYRMSVGAGLSSAIIGIVMALISVFIMALIIDALAPSFGGTKDRIQAMKTTVYAYTAGWVGSVGMIVPGVGWLIALAGFIYAFYLLYLGLIYVMKAPEEKAVGYTVVAVLAAIVLYFIVGAITGAVIGRAALGGMGSSGLFGSALGGSSGISTDDAGKVSGGLVGGLSEFAAKAEQASKKMEEAQKSGNADAQAAAAGNMVATVLGGGQQVESLATDRIKGFLPATLAGLKQETSSAERNGAMGMQVSEAKAHYGDGKERSLDLEITDMGGAKGIMGLAAWANIEQDKQTQTGYEKTYKQGENMIHEQWDSADKSGEYSAMLAGRFMVKVSGRAGSVDDLKAAVGGVDLAGLAALRNEGVKQTN